MASIPFLTKVDRGPAVGGRGDRGVRRAAIIIITNGVYAC
jgi:hypothetical protein